MTDRAAGALKRTFIPFEEWRGVGGPHTFMTNLEGWLRSQGLRTSGTFIDADLVFFPIRFDLDALHWGRVRGKKVVVRLDGIRYPEKHGEGYRTSNLAVKEIYRHYADLVIFQSDYSRRQCFEVFGELLESDYAVVVNGADRTVFFPDPDPERRPAGGRIRFATTGSFRDRAMIEPLVLALDRLENELDFELRVVGPVAEPLTPLLEREYVTHVGPLPLGGVADCLREADIFLYSHLNPPCPNSVIEAVSCGLPVVGFDSGAMRELLPWATELLAPVSDDIFQRYDDFDPTALAGAIRAAVRDYPRYREIALANADAYPFDRCAERYVDHLVSVLERRQPTKSTGVRRAFSTPARFLLKVGNRLGLGPAVRSAAIDLLVGSRRDAFIQFIMRAIRERVQELPPSESLRTLFELDRQIYEIEGQQAIRHDDGVHTKHRHIRYHDFFVDRVRETDRVLDLGCGKGELSADIAAAVRGGSVTGVDRKEASIEWAGNAFGGQDNLRFVLGDITEALPGERFDVIVLSNVLEHIEHRAELLRELVSRFSPRRMLIRVPMYQRDWRVPLKEELGIDYRLDHEHFIEYTPEAFGAEMAGAGLNIEHQEFRWGEIWAEVTP